MGIMSIGPKASLIKSDISSDLISLRSKVESLEAALLLKPKEIIVEVTKEIEVIKVEEKIVEVFVDKIVEVPVEVIRETFKEFPVYVDKIIYQPLEVIKEKIIEVPVEVIKTIEKEIIKEVKSIPVVMYVIMAIEALVIVGLLIK